MQKTKKTDFIDYIGLDPGNIMWNLTTNILSKF